MQKPKMVHSKVALRMLAHFKNLLRRGLLYKKHRHFRIVAYADPRYAGDKEDRKSMLGYYMYVGGNLIIQRSKKHNVITRSSIEAKYKAMALITCKMIWIKFLIFELDFDRSDLMLIHCNNQVAIYIANNPVFHERTKHMKIDCYFIRDAVMNKIIRIPFTPSSKQLAEILTKFLSFNIFKFMHNNLSIFHIYVPA